MGTRLSHGPSSGQRRSSSWPNRHNMGDKAATGPLRGHYYQRAMMGLPDLDLDLDPPPQA